MNLQLGTKPFEKLHKTCTVYIPLNVGKQWVKTVSHPPPPPKKKKKKKTFLMGKTLIYFNLKTNGGGGGGGGKFRWKTDLWKSVLLITISSWLLSQLSEISWIIYDSWKVVGRCSTIVIFGLKSSIYFTNDTFFNCAQVSFTQHCPNSLVLDTIVLFYYPGLSSEDVVNRALHMLVQSIDSGSCVDEFLQDQVSFHCCHLWASAVSYLISVAVF